MDATTPELHTLKQRMKATWMSGDYGLVARSIEGGADGFVERLGVTSGLRVLDVACGNGNVALAAARRGGTVTGVDIAPNLLEQARARAAAEGLSIRFDEGDAEQMPYPDGSFDLVTTMFGAMFAPRPDLTAAELVRVCRAGGRIAMANWTPDGFAGQMFRAVAAHVPPPPNVAPPVQWGDETTVRQRLQNGTTDLQMQRQICPIEYPFPPSEVVQLFRTYFGPVKQAFESLDPSGQAALRRELEAVWSAHNRATDGSTSIAAEYLEIVATKP